MSVSLKSKSGVFKTLISHRFKKIAIFCCNYKSYTWKHLLVTIKKNTKKYIYIKIQNVKIDKACLPSWTASIVNIRDLRFRCRHGIFVLLTKISGVGFAAIPPIPSIIFHSYTSQNFRIEERKKNTTFLAILEVSTVCFKI